jgi:hypothetical protein
MDCLFALNRQLVALPTSAHKTEKIIRKIMSSRESKTWRKAYLQRQCHARRFHPFFQPKENPTNTASLASEKAAR